MKLLVS